MENKNKLSKKILIPCIILLLLSIGLASTTIVSAANTTANYTDKESDTGVYIFETSDNETLLGVCLDYERSEPSSQENKNVTYTLDNATNIDNKIKEAIVKYYRNESNLTVDELQHLVWKIYGKDTYDTPRISEMYDTLTGTMEIGDSYTYDDGTFLYTFNFYYAIPSNDIEAKPAQRMLLFSYLQQPRNNTTTINETNDNSTPEIDYPVPDIVTIPEVNTTDTNKTTNNSVASATLKKTGTPINLLLLILLSLIGFGYFRKK
jgi:hypothetical protein